MSFAKHSYAMLHEKLIPHLQASTDLVALPAHQAELIKIGVPDQTFWFNLGAVSGREVELRLVHAETDDGLDYLLQFVSVCNQIDVSISLVDYGNRIDVTPEPCISYREMKRWFEQLGFESQPDGSIVRLPFCTT